MSLSLAYEERSEKVSKHSSLAVALSGVEAALDDGQLVVITGVAATGKTTLARIAIERFAHRQLSWWRWTARCLPFLNKPDLVAYCEKEALFWAAKDEGLDIPPGVPVVLDEVAGWSRRDPEGVRQVIENFIDHRTPTILIGQQWRDIAPLVNRRPPLPVYHLNIQIGSLKSFHG